MVMLVSATFVATTIYVEQRVAACQLLFNLLQVLRPQTKCAVTASQLPRSATRRSEQHVPWADMREQGFSICKCAHLADACRRALKHPRLLGRREAAMEGKHPDAVAAAHQLVQPVRRPQSADLHGQTGCGGVSGRGLGIVSVGPST